MQITYFGYNAFLLESEESTVILDPGQDLHWRRLNSLTPRSLWEQVDLILLTHGDPDHAEYAPHVARASGAPIVCGLGLMKKWQKRGLTVIPIAPGETVEAAGVSVSGVPARHGGLSLTVFGHTYTFKPKFVGVGEVGLHFSLDDCRLLNLGDTLYLADAWNGLSPDLLMVPVGGMMTMDVDEALQAVAVIEPRVVIPMHYNWHLLFYHRPADMSRFAAGVRALGSICIVLDRGESYVMGCEDTDNIDLF